MAQFYNSNSGGDDTKDPSGGIRNVPGLGDVWKGIFGDPAGVAAAYNKQIQASKEAQAQLQQFLMHQKGQTEAYYGPLQHMFTSAYGTEGIQSPQIPHAPGGPLTQMYGGK